MNLIHITTCTNRKRLKPLDTLLCRDLPRGNLSMVAEAWIDRVLFAPREHKASNIYCGRGFSESMTASRMVSTELWVISAGLGLLCANELIPPYSLTMSPGVNDSICDRIKPDFHPSEWWKSINMSSGRSFKNLIEGDENKNVFLISLSQPYLTLVIEDLMSLNDESLDRVRIVGIISRGGLPTRLQKVCMPYDTRINDPICCPGTMSDFAQRATLHFVKNVWCNARHESAEYHAAEIIKLMEGLIMPTVPKRKQLTDAEVINEISLNWDRAEGYSTRMLRILRDDLQVACEQKRFSILFKQVREGMK